VIPVVEDDFEKPVLAQIEVFVWLAGSLIAVPNVLKVTLCKPAAISFISSQRF